MAVHPVTGIDPEVDMFVYVEAFSAATFNPSDPATYRVLNFNERWRADGEPRTGANPRFMRFKKLPDEVIETDHRYTVNSIPQMVVAGSLPVTDSSLPVGTYQVTKQAVRLQLPDLLAQIETEYQRQVRLQFPETENPSTIINIGGILIKQQAGAVLTDAEAASLAAFIGVRDNIAQLAERRAELVAAATADEDYDLSVWPNLA